MSMSKIMLLTVLMVVSVNSFAALTDSKYVTKIYQDEDAGDYDEGAGDDEESAPNDDD